jgi:hypothetical protein
VRLENTTGRQSRTRVATTSASTPWPRRSVAPKASTMAPRTRWLMSNGERFHTRRLSEISERPASRRQSAGRSRPRPAAIATAHSEPDEAPAVTAIGSPASSRAAATPAWKAARHAHPSNATPIIPLRRREGRHRQT